MFIKIFCLLEKVRTNNIRDVIERLPNKKKEDKLITTALIKTKWNFIFLTDEINGKLVFILFFLGNQCLFFSEDYRLIYSLYLHTLPLYSSSRTEFAQLYIYTYIIQLSLFHCLLSLSLSLPLSGLKLISEEYFVKHDSKIN